jgi:histidinol phosphate phosphatase family protein
MAEAIESGKFDYIAHPDLYVINYRNWDESCEKAAHIISEAAEKMDVPLEVNANGIRKSFERHPDWDRYMYPYKEFWEIVKQYNVRTIIGSDAHDFNRMEDRKMEIAREFAREIGLNVIESIF